MSLIIDKDKTLSFGVVQDSLHLPTYKVNEIRIDHYDHSALYNVVAIDSSNQIFSGDTRFLIKHDGLSTVVLIAGGGDSFQPFSVYHIVKK